MPNFQLDQINTHAYEMVPSDCVWQQKRLKLYDRFEQTPFCLAFSFHFFSIRLCDGVLTKQHFEAQRN